MRDISSFDKWADAGFPGYSGVTEQAAAEALATSFVEKARIFHSVVLKDARNAEKVLSCDALDKFQSQFDALLQDLVSDCAAMIPAAATEYAPDCEPAVPPTPNFSALTAEANCAALTLKSNIKRAALTAPLSSGNGGDL